MRRSSKRYNNIYWHKYQGRKSVQQEREALFPREEAQKSKRGEQHLLLLFWHNTQGDRTTVSRQLYNLEIDIDV